ncbi:MAG TPA: cupin domain-containing protein [Actinomycetota bacterium]|nr:cupin domain-containing protein [Actinomycetota bacterium]
MRRIRAEERVAGPHTPGMDRFTALASDRVWAGGARTEPGTTSGWHHHGDHESVIYVVSGALRMEFGPGGRERFDAGPGDFVFVGRGEIHRESNPGQGPAELVVVRAGTGGSVVNVEGPPPPREDLRRAP